MMTDAALRDAVFARDGRACVRCGSPHRLHAHHRKLRSRGGPDTAENLVTLCPSCHTWVHTYPEAATIAGLVIPSWEPDPTVPYGQPERPPALPKFSDLFTQADRAGCRYESHA